jgi:prophage regulatory protein
MYCNTRRTIEPTGSSICLIRLPEVCRRTGKKRSSIYREIAAGIFPRPVRIGERASAWVEPEIDAFIAQLISERDGAA